MDFIGKNLSRDGRNSTSSSQSFRDGRTPGPNDVFIAVMGVTGSGKSSFISLCSSKPVKIGHTLEACTSTVGVYAYDMLPDRTVYLIDTPGFDDTNRSDTEVLSEIASWLVGSYKGKILLHGIIYLHRITDIRMQGSAQKNLLMFRKLCGPEALKIVVLATTMWDKVSNEDGMKREKELKDTPEFWGWMIGKGSSCHRHDNTKASAMDIVHKLAKINAPRATDLQRQIVDERRRLDQTGAGQEVQSETLKKRERLAQKYRENEQQMRDAIQEHDREAEEILRKERDKYTRMIKKAENDTGALRSTMENLLAKHDKRVAQMEEQMKAQQNAHNEELRRIKDRQRQLEQEKEKLEKERERDRQAQQEQERQAQQEQERQAQQEQERQAKRDKRIARMEEQMRAQQEANNEELRQIKDVQRRLEQENQKLERGKAQERQVSQYRDEQAQKGVSWSTAGFPPYSVSMMGSSYYCNSPFQWCSNLGSHPKQREGSGVLKGVSIGDVWNGETQWVAHFSNNNWQHSKDLVQSYSHLAASIDAYGLGNLEICVLGPSPIYYARWLNGHWRSWTSDDANIAFNQCSSTGSGPKVWSVAFGYGNSYVLSYGYSSDLKNLCNMYDLKGHYPQLAQFLVSNPMIAILAVTLNPTNTTDFVVVYQHCHGDNTVGGLWYCSDPSMLQTINDWWNNGAAEL
ncbi:hypothetical protein B0O99DRAFT_619267 [Bisporella sp. PMI_857]|nr:hypothetical protein B0O99DRAFT_619267 [Bisporella sp. PMI_857]